MKFFILSMIILLVGCSSGVKTADVSISNRKPADAQRRFVVVDMDKTISVALKYGKHGRFQDSFVVKCSDFLYGDIIHIDHYGNRQRINLLGTKLYVGGNRNVKSAEWVSIHDGNQGSLSNFDMGLVTQQLSSKFESECLAPSWSVDQIKDYYGTSMKTQYEDLLNDVRFREQFVNSLLEHRREELIQYFILRAKDDLVKAMKEAIVKPKTSENKKRIGIL